MRYKLPFTGLSAVKNSFTIYLSNLLWHMRGVPEEGNFKICSFLQSAVTYYIQAAYCSKLQFAAIYNISFI